MITFLLFCVFGVGPASEGHVREIPVTLALRDFRRLAHEEGHAAKIGLCREYFGKTPDLAWIEPDHSREM